jgi:RHS repeat-associated protein
MRRAVRASQVDRPHIASRGMSRPIATATFLLAWASGLVLVDPVFGCHPDPNDEPEFGQATGAPPLTAPARSSYIPSYGPASIGGAPGGPGSGCGGGSGGGGGNGYGPGGPFGPLGPYGPNGPGGGPGGLGPNGGPGGGNGDGPDPDDNRKTGCADPGDGTAPLDDNVQPLTGDLNLYETDLLIDLGGGIGDGMLEGGGGGGIGGPGGSCKFAVSRSYTSAIDVYSVGESGGSGAIGYADTITDSRGLNDNAYGQLGNNWMLSTSHQLFFNGTTSAQLVSGHGTGVEFVWDGGEATPEASGPAPQTLIALPSGYPDAHASIPSSLRSGIDYVDIDAAYVLRKPGGREYVFAGDAGERSEGRLLAEYDGMGRLIAAYEYEESIHYDGTTPLTALLFSDDPSTGPFAGSSNDVIAIRLARVYLFNQASECAGYISYRYGVQTYKVDSGDPDPDYPEDLGVAPIGPVKQVQVYRIEDPSLPTVSVLTQEVEYFYQGMAADPEYCGLTDTCGFRDEDFGASPIDGGDQGTNYAIRDTWSVTELGPLGSLIQVYKRVLLNDGNYREFITQYRYHDDGERWYTEGDERLQVGGDGEQLKMEFEPYVFEWLAEQVPGWTIRDAATALLAANDGDEIGGTMTSGVTPYEIASRIVSYDDNSASDIDRMYRSGDCGCAGSGGASPTKKVYSYIDYDLASASWTDSVTWDLLCDDITGTAMGRTASIIEHEWDADAMPPAFVAYRETRTDYVPTLDASSPDRIIARAERAAGGSDWWVTGYKYEPCSSLLTHVYFPSAIASYTAAVGTTPASWAPKASDGYVARFAYNSDGRRIKKWIRNGPDTLTSGFDEFDLIWESQYQTSNGRDDLLAWTKRYRVKDPDPMDDTDWETTTFAYGFWTTPSQQPARVAWRKVSVEPESSTENGPAHGETTHDSYELYDEDGNSIWVIGHDGTATKRVYISTSGKLFSVTANATPGSGVFDDWTTTSGGPSTPLGTSVVAGWGPVGTAPAVSLTTTYLYDVLGRVVRLTDPTGADTYISRLMLDTDYLETGDAVDDTLGDLTEFSWWTAIAERYVEFRSGRESNIAGDYESPGTLSWYDAAGRMLRRSTIPLDEVDISQEPPVIILPGGGPGESNPPSGSVAMGTVQEMSRTVWRRDVGGTLYERYEWPLLENQERYATTRYEYDGLGRQVRMISAEGAVAETDFDFLDRPTATYTRTVDGMGSLTDAVKTSDMQYDGGDEGDGTLTRMRYFGTDAGTLPRVTTNYYDWRNRLIFTVSPPDPADPTKLDTPDAAFAYDNLDRVTETALYEDDPSRDSSFTPFAPSSNTNRIRYTTNSYSQRGLLFRSRSAIEPSLSSPTFLTSNIWFDSKGRVIASSAPTQPMQKMVYDSLNRVTAMYMTDGSDGSGGVDDTWAEMDDVLGDRVVQQSENVYIGRRLVLTKNRLRTPGSTATGALTVSNSVSTYTGFGYDFFDRTVAVVDFGASNSTSASGTGSSNVFAIGGTDPTSSDVTTVLNAITSYVPATSPTAPRVVRTGYNTRGVVAGTIDHMGITTNTVYDDMSRPVSTVVNATEWTNEEDLFWDTSALTYTWDPNAITTSPKPADQDLATSQVYDLDGRVVLRTAHLHDSTLASTSRQDTKYVYGITKSTGGSELNSNELLGEIHYPDESSGAPGTTAEYKVFFDYNAFGEVIRMTDQSGVEHSYEYDGAGRQIRDEVDLSGVVSGVGVDSAVLAIEQDFDAAGRLQTVTSLDSAGGSPGTVNEVRYEYDSLWNVYLVYQNATGAVDTTTGNCGGDEDTQLIGYWYDIEDDTAGNYVRLDRTIYPSDFASAGTIDDPSNLDPSSPASKVQGFTVTYDYGTAGGLDDLISRRLAHEADLTTVGGETMVEYEYLGLGLPVTVDYDKIAVSLSRSVEHDGSSAAGVFANLDRFGRIRRDLWIDDSFTTGTGGLSNQPAVFDRAYRYDARGNLASDVEERQDYDTYASGSYDGYAVDQLHTYDAIGRLTATAMGRVTDPTAGTLTIGTHVDGSEAWDLGELANWRTYGRDANADGDVADVLELDARAFNAANELEEILFDLDPNPDRGDDLLYTPAGNTRSSTTKSTGPSDPSVATNYVYDAWNRLRSVQYSGSFVARHWYNGLGWMVRKRVSTLEPSQGVGGPDEERRYYYAPEWRMLEEHVDTDLADSTDIDYKAQQFWGDRYIDDAVARRIDRDADSDYTDETESLFFYVTDRMFSVRQLLRGEATSTPFIVEEIYYSPYGVPYRRMTIDYAATFGEFDSSSDVSAFSTGLGNGGTIGDGTYASEFDVNRSGGVTFSDFSAIGGEFPTASESLGPTGWMSQPQRVDGSDSSIGYAGYSQLRSGDEWLVRHRAFLSFNGRWLQRDPAGYIGSSNLYNYAHSNPTLFADPSGLIPSTTNANCTTYSTTVNHAFGAAPPSVGLLTVSVAGSIGFSYSFEIQRCQECCPEGGSGTSTSVGLSGSVGFEARIRGGSVFQQRIENIGKFKAAVSAYVGVQISASGSTKFSGSGGWSTCDEGASPSFKTCFSIDGSGEVAVGGMADLSLSWRKWSWTSKIGVEGFGRATFQLMDICIECDSVGCRPVVPTTWRFGSVRIRTGVRACYGKFCTEFVLTDKTLGGLGI